MFAQEKIKVLMNKGVKIPNPYSLDIGNSVDPDKISGDGVVIYPGCRIYGEKTTIGSGTKLGYEGPVTLENCQIGQKVELKGGFFKKSVFLEKANMALGAHVREGCILEEEANGAHCVGLKQTILFPFVTLGSLINFCDCLMAGGTSRRNHSEVGSSYIHFNYTPDQDKTTSSLIGDVPRGVMLNQPPIYLGGQGGIVGPLYMGFGCVVAAGSVLRKDYPEDNQLLAEGFSLSAHKNFVPYLYPRIGNIVNKTVRYVANLMTLEQWYIYVRRPFLQEQQFGGDLYDGAMAVLTLAREQRLKYLRVLTDKMGGHAEKSGVSSLLSKKKYELSRNKDKLLNLLTSDQAGEIGAGKRDAFLDKVLGGRSPRSGDYVETIQNLSSETSVLGTQWLSAIIDNVCEETWKILPSFRC